MVITRKPESTPTAGQLMRPRYFPRQVVTAADLRADQDYVRGRLRRHNRLVHGCGAVCGLEVLRDPHTTTGMPSLIVTAGYALSPQGDEIYVPDQVTIAIDCVQDVTGDCLDLEAVPAGQRVYLAIRYVDEEVHLVPALPDRCAPVATCEYSRFRAGFEIACLNYVPETCRPPELDCEAVLRELGQRTPPGSLADIPPLFACPPEPSEPWIVLACLDLDPEGGLTIDYSVRSQILSTRLLQEILRCVPSAPRPTLEPTEFTVIPTELTIAPTVFTVIPTELTIAPTVFTVIPTELTIAPTEFTIFPTELTLAPTFGPTFFDPVDFPDRVVDEVTGIGPVFAARLEGNGITNLAGLASMEPGALAEVLGVSEVRAMGFIDQARGLLTG